jgi:hypothetical protein
MTRRHGLADGRADERIGLGDGLKRPRARRRRLDSERDEVGGPDADGGQAEAEVDVAARQEGEQRREGNPDEPRIPDDRKRDEDRIEPTGPVLDDPEEDGFVYARMSCFVDSIS